MPNATAHRSGAAITVTLVSICNELDKEQADFVKPVANAALAALLGTLPDIIEPAVNPNHRQFFHSVTALGLIGYGSYKLWKWEPENDLDKFIKTLALIGCGSYMTHLLMDSTTPKSLPLI